MSRNLVRSSAAAPTVGPLPHPYPTPDLLTTGILVSLVGILAWLRLPPKAKGHGGNRDLSKVKLAVKAIAFARRGRAQSLYDHKTLLSLEDFVKKIGGAPRPGKAWERQPRTARVYRERPG